MAIDPDNIREVTDHPEEFVSHDTPKINYMRSTNAWARERVQSSLIKCIKVRTYKEMRSREDLGQRFPLIPPTSPTLPLGAKKPREYELEHEFVFKL